MIRLTQLQFGYGREDLFSNLNLAIPAGRICGLLGKNGVGKTTLLKLIAGLRFVKSGECRVLDQFSGHRSVSMLSDIYYLPEEFELPDVPVQIYLNMVAPFYPRFHYRRFEEYTQRFELDINKTLGEYSFGQKKKFILAFGLTTNTRILLLDEPTNGLDIPSKSQFRKVLASEYSEDRLILISTHQARDLENIIDSIIILDDGDILFNQMLSDVSERMSIRLLSEQPATENALYSETVPGGYAVVTDEVDAEDNTLDLEIIFKSVLSNPSRIAEIFGEETKEENHAG